MDVGFHASPGEMVSEARRHSRLWHHRTCQRIGCGAPSMWGVVVLIYAVEEEAPVIAVSTTLGFCDVHRVFATEHLLQDVADRAVSMMAPVDVDKNRSTCEMFRIEEVTSAN